MSRFPSHLLFFLLVLSAILIILPVSATEENSTTRVNPVVDHSIGDTFTITGTTNLAVGNDLLVEIYSSSFNPTQKVQGSGFSGSSGTVKVMPGTDGYNTWSFDVDTFTFIADEYFVKVSGTTNNVLASTTFTIREHVPVSNQTITTGPAIIQTTSPITSTTTAPQSPLLPVTLLVAFGITGCAILLKRK